MMAAPEAILTEDTMGWQEWQELEHKHPSIRLTEGGDYITLAQPCVRCRGEGRIVVSDGQMYENSSIEAIHHERCAPCGGCGMIATEDGKALARFFQVFGLGQAVLA